MRHLHSVRGALCLHYQSFKPNFSFDLQTLNPERVDLLERLMPNEEEEHAFDSFKASGRSKEELTEDDQFMIAVS